MINENNQKMTTAEGKDHGKASLQLSGKDVIVEGKDPGKAGPRSGKAASVEGKEPGKANPHSLEESTEDRSHSKKVVKGKDPGESVPQPLEEGKPDPTGFCKEWPPASDEEHYKNTMSKDTSPVETR